MAEDRAPLDPTSRDLRDNDVEFEALVREVARAPVPTIGNILTPKTIVGEYQIEAVVGRGGCGTVYTALHPVIGKRVAIKVLRHDLSSDPKAVDRFVKEAQAVNRIAHPNIVDVFGFGSLLDGRKYCVMEYVEGTTLAQQFRNGGGLDPAVIAKLLEPVALALDAAHARGIVHRDLKPENILVDSKGVLKLLDFGIAKMVGDDRGVATTQTGMLLGTPAYMSPEQCKGLPVDPRSDVYALGVIVYELLTGHRPIAGENVLQVISQHIVAVPAPPSHYRSELSPAIDRAVLSMLEKSPDRRPASASEALSRLESADRGLISMEDASVATPSGNAASSGRGRGGARVTWQKIFGPALLVSAMGVMAVVWQQRSAGSSDGAAPGNGSVAEKGESELEFSHPPNVRDSLGPPDTQNSEIVFDEPALASTGDEKAVKLSELFDEVGEEVEAKQARLATQPVKAPARAPVQVPSKGPLNGPAKGQQASQPQQNASSSPKTSGQQKQPVSNPPIAIDRRDPWAQ